MTIHHDKMSYGKIKPLCDDMTEDEICALLKEMDGDEEDVKDTGATEAPGKEGKADP